MKRNSKYYRQKKLRKKLEEYLKENRRNPHYSDKWTPGEPKNAEIKRMIRAKIGAGNMLTKGARKWKAVKRKQEHKRNRNQKNILDF